MHSYVFGAGARRTHCFPIVSLSSVRHGLSAGSHRVCFPSEQQHTCLTLLWSSNQPALLINTSPLSVHHHLLILHPDVASKQTLHDRFHYASSPFYAPTHHDYRFWSSRS